MKPMKLDYLHDGSADCPILRLSEFPQSEVTSLGDQTVKLCAGTLDHVTVNSMPGVVTVHGAVLTLVLAAADEGVVRLDGGEFECRLSAGQWIRVAELLEPFCAGSTGSQWLDETSNISLLITKSGMF